MQLKNAIAGVAGAGALCVSGSAQPTGLQARLRSSNVLIPGATPGVVSPTATAGDVVSGAQASFFRWDGPAARVAPHRMRLKGARSSCRTGVGFLGA